MVSVKGIYFSCKLLSPFCELGNACRIRNETGRRHDSYPQVVHSVAREKKVSEEVIAIQLGRCYNNSTQRVLWESRWWAANPNRGIIEQPQIPNSVYGTH